MEASTKTKSNLAKKMVEVRRACIGIQKQKHSSQVSYKYAKLSDVLELIRPVMDSVGVDFAILGETPTAIDATGNRIYVREYEQRTKYGSRTMWIYESDLTVAFVDCDTGEKEESVTHAIAWNDDPAKAKGAALTYAIKYFLFYRLLIPLDDDDPDARDFSPRRQQRGWQEQEPEEKSIPQSAVMEIYDRAEDVGWSRRQVFGAIQKQFHKPIDQLTEAEYKKIIGKFDSIKKEREEKELEGQDA